MQNRGIPVVDVTNDIENALMKAKFDLVRTYPFIGFLVMTCQYMFSRALPTAGALAGNTGAPIVYNNPDFLMSLPKKQRAWVQLHEVLHIFLAHGGRQKDRAYHHELWNIACDYVINLYISDIIAENANAREFLEPWPHQLCEERFRDMSADEVYSLLLQENDGNADKAVAANGGGSPSDEDGEGEGQASASGRRVFDQVSAESIGEAREQEIKQMVAAAVAQGMGDKQIGQGAAGLFRQFQAMLEPVIPWKQVLQEWVETTVSDQYTYKRPSRRSSANVIFPSRTGERINLWFGIDTSGSMDNEDLNDGASELWSICEEFDHWKISLLSCDQTAHIIGQWSSQEGDQFETIDKNLIGGGGTDMSPMIALANEAEGDDRPNVLVIITDGYIPPYDCVEDGMPVITVVTRKGNQSLDLEDSLVIQMSREG